MGNGTISETGEERLMHRAFAALRRAVPQEWSIQVDETTGAADRRLDAVLTVGSPSGAVVRFAVEVKSMSRGAAGDAVRQAEAISRQEGLPAVVVTDFANPALRNACLERGVGFVDETGWVSLRHDADPSMLVSLQGAQRVSPDRETAVMERLDGPGASKVIRALWEVTIPIGVRELAEHAKVSPGTVAKMLPTLAQAGAVDRNAAGAVIGRNRRLLLDRWTQDYSFTDSNRDVLWLLAPRGVAPLDQAIVRLPQSTMIVSTGSLGARNLLNGELLSVTPLTLWACYTTDPKALADELGLRPTSRTAANVVLARPRDTDLLKTIGHGMVLAVPPVQVLADLMTMAGRFPDEAKQLFDVLYPNEPNIAQ